MKQMFLLFFSHQPTCNCALQLFSSCPFGPSAPQSQARAKEAGGCSPEMPPALNTSLQRGQLRTSVLRMAKVLETVTNKKSVTNFFFL